MPFDGKSKEQLFEQIQEGNFTKDEKWLLVSAEGKKFVEACLTVNQDDRPGPADLLKFEWIAQVKTKKLES